MKEATARIKINKLLEAAGWRFFADGSDPPTSASNPASRSSRQTSTPLARISRRPPRATSTSCCSMRKASRSSFWKPSPKTRTRSSARNRPANMPARRIAASSSSPTATSTTSGIWSAATHTSSPPSHTRSVTGYQKVAPDPQRLIEEQVGDDYIVLTQRPSYAVRSCVEE